MFLLPSTCFHFRRCSSSTFTSTSCEPKGRLSATPEDTAVATSMVSSSWASSNSSDCPGASSACLHSVEVSSAVSTAAVGFAVVWDYSEDARRGPRCFHHHLHLQTTRSARPERCSRRQPPSPLHPSSRALSHLLLVPSPTRTFARSRSSHGRNAGKAHSAELCTSAERTQSCDTIGTWGLVSEQ